MPLGICPLASIAVFEAHNVVLAEITTRLHLDNMQWNTARILDAMANAAGKKGRLILLDRVSLLPPGDSGGTGHYDPMLGAMMMHLQRQHAAGMHRQALDLKTLA